jgi:bromodomain adjacent to zinc finger domain protein 1A
MNALVKDEPSASNGAKEPNDVTESKESNDPKDPKDLKESKDSKESKESKESKDSKDSKESKENQDMEQDEIEVESELSDVDSVVSPLSDIDCSDAETASGADRGRSGSSRQKALRLKAQSQAHAKQREIARAKTASAKQAQAEHRRLDEEDNKLERRMEGIEREFRKWSGVVRLKPLGKDRFHNRYWWFDGIGGSSLVASGGTTLYAAGRLFIQGPAESDIEIMERKQREDPPFDLKERRLDQEGVEGILGSGSWGYYSEPEQVCLFTFSSHCYFSHFLTSLRS